MLRLRSLVISAGSTALALSGPAIAASDITIAAIATGRLYVIGTTDHPHTPVMLDEKFRTESDDKGKFQYELVYYPASCIVAASIDGMPHEAVVSNCGQQMVPETWLEPKAAIDAPALLKRLTSAKAELTSAALCKTNSPEQPRGFGAAEPTIPAPPIFTVAAWANFFTQGEAASINFTGTIEAITPAAISQDASKSTSTTAIQPATQFSAWSIK